jgi:hypothetical protein
MPHRRWTAEEKIRIVLESLNTSIGVAELCRKYAVNPIRVNKVELLKSFREKGLSRVCPTIKEIYNSLARFDVVISMAQVASRPRGLSSAAFLRSMSYNITLLPNLDSPWPIRSLYKCIDVLLNA